VIKRCIPAKESTKLCYQNDHSKIVEEFNSYFTSVGRLTADRVKELAEENGVLIPTPEPLKNPQSYNTGGNVPTERCHP
jgi:hypothetical protein